MSTQITIDLTEYDDDFEPQSKRVTLTGEAVSDIVAQALDVVREAANGGSELWCCVGELRESLETCSLIEPE